MLYKIEKIEIIGDKIYCTIYNKYEKFNSIPIIKLIVIRKNGKLYAKLRFNEENGQLEKERNRNNISEMREIRHKLA